MTEEQLKEIEARANAATPGPWSGDVGQHPPYPLVVRAPVAVNFSTDVVATVTRIPASTDREFIAHAREDVPALVAALRDAWAAIEILKTHLHHERNAARALAQAPSFADGTLRGIADHERWEAALPPFPETGHAWDRFSLEPRAVPPAEPVIPPGLLGTLEETPAGGVVRCRCGWRSEPITDRYVDIGRVLTAHRATAEHVEDDSDRGDGAHPRDRGCHR